VDESVRVEKRTDPLPPYIFERGYAHGADDQLT